MSHIKCSTEKNLSWCGQELDRTFYFENAEAAVLNGRYGDVQVCKDCVNEVIKLLYSNIEELDKL